MKSHHFCPSWKNPLLATALEKSFGHPRSCAIMDRLGINCVNANGWNQHQRLLRHWWVSLLCDACVVSDPLEVAVPLCCQWWRWNCCFHNFSDCCWFVIFRVAVWCVSWNARPGRGEVTLERLLAAFNKDWGTNGRFWKSNKHIFPFKSRGVYIEPMPNEHVAKSSQQDSCFDAQNQEKYIPFRDHMLWSQKSETMPLTSPICFWSIGLSFEIQSFGKLSETVTICSQLRPKPDAMSVRTNEMSCARKQCILANVWFIVCHGADRRVEQNVSKSLCFYT